MPQAAGVFFTAGAIGAPRRRDADVQLGAEGPLRGSAIVKADETAKRADAVLKARTLFEDRSVIAKVARGLAVRG